MNYPLHQLVGFVSERLPNVELELAPSITNLEEAFNSRREQYHSTRMMVILENHPTLSHFERRLGVTSLDLYNPGRDGEGFVFGESRSPGSSGIVSTFRFVSHRPDVFDDRVKKEVAHELGHLVGLKHRTNPQCVMHQSMIVSDIDTKMNDYCDRCRRVLGESGS